jgi:CBS domain-containing protein
VTKIDPYWATPRPVTERWGLVTARDLMRTDVVTVSYSAPLSEVERVLSDHRISGVPVTDAAGHIIGVVSLKDIVEHYTDDPDARPRRGRGFYHLSTEETDDEDFESFEVPEEAEETAQDLMTAQVFSVPPEAGIQQIAAVMAKHKIHRVLVQEHGRYVGLISTLEILEALAE